MSKTRKVFFIKVQGDWDKNSIYHRWELYRIDLKKEVMKLWGLVSSYLNLSFKYRK